MAKKIGMRVAGVIENMSYLVETGQALFGTGGGQALASEVEVPLLGHVPLDPLLRELADQGRPVVVDAPRLRGLEGDQRDRRAARRLAAGLGRRHPQAASARAGLDGAS